MNAKSNTGPIVGGVISGILGLLLILVAALCFLRRRKRARSSSNRVPYSPVERGDSPEIEETSQLPPIRTTTPLTWPVNLSRSPEPRADTTNNGAAAATQLQAASVSNNPFRTATPSHAGVSKNPFITAAPSQASSSTKLVDAPSLRLSGRSSSDGTNPFEEDNNQYWTINSNGSLDAAFPESEMLDHARAPSSVTATEKVQADNLSVISDCPYPVLAPDAEKVARHLSVKSGLSYATLTSQQIRKREGHLSRASSTSSFSSDHVVNVSGNLCRF